MPQEWPKKKVKKKKKKIKENKRKEDVVYICNGILLSHKKE